MKKKLVLSLALVSLINVACKKEITCECTETYTSTFTNAQGANQTQTNDPSTTTTTYKKIKKSNLGTLCGDSKYSSTSTSNNGGVSSSNSYSSETKCKIK